MWQALGANLLQEQSIWEARSGQGHWGQRLHDPAGSEVPDGQVQGRGACFLDAGQPPKLAGLSLPAFPRLLPGDSEKGPEAEHPSQSLNSCRFISELLQDSVNDLLRGPRGALVTSSSLKSKKPEVGPGLRRKRGALRAIPGTVGAPQHCWA